MTQKYDRFNLEAEIMSVWNTKDDLQSITSRMMDDPDGPMTEDEENLCGTVYGYVPCSIIDKVIEKHGGIDEGAIKVI